MLLADNLTKKIPDLTKSKELNYYFENMEGKKICIKKCKKTMVT